MSDASARVPVWEDPRVLRGLGAQHGLRRRLEDRGDTTIGWKVSFGAPAAQRQYGIDAPLTGFLSASARLPEGASCAIGTWERPMVEPEIAVHLGRDLVGGSDPAAATRAISAIAPALELVDVQGPLDDLEAVLAGNLFQRAVVLGAPDERWAGNGVDGLGIDVRCNGERIPADDDPARALGTGLGDLLSHVADVLEATGARLRAGDVVITGALVPPIRVDPGQRVEFALTPLGTVEVGLIT